MDSRIYTRLKALDAAIIRKKAEQALPVDSLSRSLMEFSAELSGLNSLGKSALMAELNSGDPLDGSMGLHLSMQDIDRFCVEI